MKFEIFTTNRFLGVYDISDIFNNEVSIVAVGTLIVINDKKYCIKDILVREDGNARLTV
ncbi:hypothetical protein JDW19_04040 [Paenibacillus polymyxa]|uniref:Uncharacterized protein n=1 Tax=Paenibacillus polymyxa TaxID=1406 RepID=A0A8I1ITL7_PAEPO|nr:MULTISPECIES: hypothetical protein [Paenibacillus]KAF6574988.1 hypothetical protein G9G53_08040 [Paenibacillus sp. EKM206P]KAF6590338.1 hypothetical protein G9G52_06285 [Paenibacillus sp. EKM205P]MBM0632300.1 hypothetical protein [Paenibacillus polymyxa]